MLKKVNIRSTKELSINHVTLFRPLFNPSPLHVTPRRQSTDPPPLMLRNFLPDRFTPFFIVFVTGHAK